MSCVNFGMYCGRMKFELLNCRLDQAAAAAAASISLFLVLYYGRQQQNWFTRLGLRLLSSPSGSLLQLRGRTLVSSTLISICGIFCLIW
jgi:hypothetical protein